jgi:hypothetical protein
MIVPMVKRTLRGFSLLGISAITSRKYVAFRPAGMSLYLMKWIVSVPVVHLYPCASRPISSAQHSVHRCPSVLFNRSLYSTTFPVSGWIAL